MMGKKTERMKKYGEKIYYSPLHIFRSVMDWIFPSYCDICGNGREKGALLCIDCSSELIRQEDQLCCLRCGKPIYGHVEAVEDCADCRERNFYLDGVKSLYLNKGAVHDLILKLKYAGRLHLARLFADELADWLILSGVEKEAVIVPVPQSLRSRMKRGYNQAEELARRVSRRTGMEYRDILSKKAFALSQTQMNRRERLSVNRRAISVKKKYRTNEWGGRTFLLLDDVYTTGATLNECAHAVKKIFPGSKVIAVTLLRS